jgi:hypothetical protein
MGVGEQGSDGTDDQREKNTGSKEYAGPDWESDHTEHLQPLMDKPDYQYNRICITVPVIYHQDGSAERRR